MIRAPIVLVIHRGFQLRRAGQSPWLDNLSRQLLKSGTLRSWIQRNGLLGVTSNPTIFEKAINQPQGGYEAEIRKMSARSAATLEIYDALTIADIQRTCDLFAPVYRESGGEHGFVSLEVLPILAYEEEKTVQEAQRLFKAVGRPNVMIKVPSTPQGVHAVRRLTAGGININITLMFSLKHYQEVAAAYLEGLEVYRAGGGNLKHVHSVASVFVSRIDTLVDKKLAAFMEKAKGPEEKSEYETLQGRAAVANSKLIYQEFKKIFGSEKFKNLQRAGARTQKVLWGSTSTKNPRYSDLMYVEPLIGKETVNTMPTATWEAFLDHGKVVADSVEQGIDEARETVKQLEALGIDLLEAGEALQQEGVKSFSDSFEALMRALEKKRTSSEDRSPSVKISFTLPETAQESIAKRIEVLQKEGVHARFLEADPTLWSRDAHHQSVIRNRMGWLNDGDWILGRLYEVDELCREVRIEKIRDIVLMGMGGSSLAPEVLHRILPRRAKSPRFHVLDTTDPSSIHKIEKSISLKLTFFIVASKSGSTIETLSQYRAFYDKVFKEKKAKAGENFIAITDAGSALEREAHAKNFRKIFINPSDIGGRYSALSFFGLVPAALAGIDVRKVLRGAGTAYEAARAEALIEKNSAMKLGMVLGESAASGRDKVTLWTGRALVPFGAWLEQLIAESTGKEGKGIIPIQGEPPGDPEVYGKDRVFVVLKLKGEKSTSLNRKVQAVKKAGFPVIEIQWRKVFSVGADFLNWEIATAVSSMVLGTDPFDEPNVQESKDFTRALLEECEKGAKLDFPADTLRLDSDSSHKNQTALGRLFSEVKTSGYVAILAYLRRSAETEKFLASLQMKIRGKIKTPVLAGFGPRYLHSIGQLYKGGPKTGAFLIVLAHDTHDLKIPGVNYTFGRLKLAQALGDLRAFRKRNLPVLTVDLGKKIPEGLKRLEKLIDIYLHSRAR